MGDFQHLDPLIGEQVIVTLQSGREVVGVLDSYDDNFSIKLTGSGTPEDPTLGDLRTNYVDGAEVFNGSNVESVKSEN